MVGYYRLCSIWYGQSNQLNTNLTFHPFWHYKFLILWLFSAVNKLDQGCFFYYADSNITFLPPLRPSLHCTDVHFWFQSDLILFRISSSKNEDIYSKLFLSKTRKYPFNQQWRILILKVRARSSRPWDQRGDPSGPALKMIFLGLADFTLAQK